MRTALALLLILAAAAPGAAAPPTGHRTPRPRPTHVVVAEARLDAGGGVVAVLEPGTPVQAAARGRASPRGKVKVSLTGAVALKGTVDAAQLGQRVARDVPLHDAAGKAEIGRVRAGALVRVLSGAAAGGRVLVETLGPVTAKGSLPADALSAEPHELVLEGEWDVKAHKALDLYPSKDVKGPARARLAPGARMTVVEQVGQVAHVRTYGAHEVDGWTIIDVLADRAPEDKPGAEPDLIKPTHEILVDAPFYAGADGKRAVGTLRGGTLVQLIPTLDKSALEKVLTAGGVNATGWVKRTDLRPVDIGSGP